ASVEQLQETRVLSFQLPEPVLLDPAPHPVKRHAKGAVLLNNGVTVEQRLHPGFISSPVVADSAPHLTPRVVRHSFRCRGVLLSMPSFLTLTRNAPFLDAKKVCKVAEHGCLLLLPVPQSMEGNLVGEYE